MKALFVKEWKASGKGKILLISSISPFVLLILIFKFILLPYEFDYPSFLYSNILSNYFIIFGVFITLILTFISISSEFDMKTSNYLYSKPISRESIFLTKALFVMLNIFLIILILTLVIVPSSIIIKQRAPFYLLGICGLHAFFMLLTLESLLLYIMIIQKKIFYFLPIIYFSIIVLFVLSFIPFLKWLNPMNLFCSINVIKTHQIEWMRILVCLVITFIFHLLSLYAIKRKSF
jgi:ABC-type transport system involved in multi-copper enzyme maturation permease subunit